MLRLSAPAEPRSLRMAVDFFLRSLAEDQHERAIGIILSGTGTDGTLGLKEIKAAGGMTMVQDPQTAQHDGMPRSAIASGSADYVLPAEQMADALLAYVRHAASRRDQHERRCRRSAATRWRARWRCCTRAPSSTSAATRRRPCGGASSAA